MSEKTPTTTHPREALDTAIEAARLAEPQIHTKDGRHFAYVPDGMRLIDISDPEILLDHIHAHVKLDDAESLIAYTNRFSATNSILVADIDDGVIRACLDWHTHNDADPSHEKLTRRHAHHTATLRLRYSEEFARWDKMQGKMHSQAAFAEFIEENVADLHDPDHGTMIEICRDLEATQDGKFRAGTRLESGDRTFHYETETVVKGELTVPTEITLLIPIYFGEEPVELRAKFRFRASAGGLELGFVWHRVEHQRQATFRQIATDVAGDTGLPVFHGRAPST